MMVSAEHLLESTGTANRFAPGGSCGGYTTNLALGYFRGVYHRAPNIVVRCPVSEDVPGRLVQTSTDGWLDFRGAQSWCVPTAVR